MSVSIDLITVIVASTLVGNEFAIAMFVHPQLCKLPAQGHAEAVKLLAIVLGRVMPFWYALALLLLCITAYGHGPVSHGPGRTIALAAIGWAATILLTVTMLVPINTRLARLEPNAAYPGWLEDHARWDRLHWVRIAILSVCVCLLLLGVLPSK